MLLCGTVDWRGAGASSKSETPKLGLRIFRGEGVPGDPSYDVELDLDPERDAENDREQGKDCGRKFKERLEVSFDAFDVTIAGGQVILGLIGCGGDGIPFALQDMLRVVLRSGVKYGMQEASLETPEFKIPLLAVRCSQGAERPLFIDVDGKASLFLNGESSPTVGSEDVKPLMLRLLEQLNKCGHSALSVSKVDRCIRPDFLFRSGVLIPVPKQE